jgi:DUF4097 and DUF4098 domain-containing protein YvlB
MNRKIVWSLIVVLAMNLSAMGWVLHDPALDSSTQTKQDYPARGEINESYQLSPNANVEVRGIEGAVKVETSNDNRAEIHFVRHARTQRDYDCETIVVQHSQTSLTVHHQTNPSCRVIQAYEELTLIVPRTANLSFGRIEGDFTVGRTEGYLQLSHIEGSVRAGEVQAAEIEHIEGGVTLHIARLDSQGVTVRYVEGDVELNVAGSVNANLRVQRAENVEIDIPNAAASRTGGRNYSLQLGAGGANISISGIEGSVRIRGV